MVTPPGSYVTGAVAFEALLSHGDPDGDSLVNFSEANGTITFAPAKSTYKSLTRPTVMVGNQILTAQVRQGKLVNAKGEPWYFVPVGRWRVTFGIKGMTVPSVVVNVQLHHTPSEPMDLAHEVEVSAMREIDEDDPETNIVIIDTEDGGYELDPQTFMYADGTQGRLVLIDNGDGGVTVSTE